ncbi:acyltransferase family protein [Spirosoma agri]|uniref:Acyltransferase n=1 Tax=Spirosoma agri TaxID=1987381 RepID=A0A6M0ICB6_9BACT|nr:acyltransferase [Spirosoma agri]NEU65890.1 acyltransferase [Spirosoma agri]
MSANNPSAVYFRGFNGVRFLAASSVVFHHIEQFKTTFGYTDTFTHTNEHPVVYQAGRLGVALFFVLSGFLITYLLLAEKQSSGRIHIGNFYVRRILRIWPLYFWIIGLSFFVFPHIPALYIPGVSEFANDHFWPKLALFGLVMPNIALTFYHEMPLCSHTWSIGVEEQFYLIWPWLIGSLRPRRTLLVLASIALVMAGGFFWLRYGPGSTAPEAGTTMLLVSDFLAHFRIGTMAIGGIGAYLVFKKSPVLDVLYRKSVQWVVYAILAVLLATGVRIPGLNYEGYALFFVFLLMNLAANPNSVIDLEKPLFNFMGKISYGLYMYHPIAIVLCLYVIRQFLPYSLGFSIILYVTSYALTTLLAWLSYEYFEKQFLKLKDRFAPNDKPVAKPQPVRV